MISRPIPSRRSGLHAGPVMAGLMLFAMTANAQTEAEAPAGTDSPAIHEYMEIDYFEGPEADPERHDLNLLVPVSDTPVPVLIWIPSGAWALGSKEAQTPVARRIAAHGIAVAAVDHRMSPPPSPESDVPIESGAKHPDHIRDIARATAWVIANAEQYGLDSNNVFVGGYSSGAHLAALLVMDPSYLQEVGLDRDRIRAAIPVAGGYNMKPYRDAIYEELGAEFGDRHILGVFGSDAMLEEASPATYLADATVPMLILSEGALHQYTEWFVQDVAAADMGDLIQFSLYEDHTHQSLFQELRDLEDSPARDEIVAYIKKMSD